MTSFPAATWLFFRAHVGRFFQTRRALVCGALALLPGALALLIPAVGTRAGAREIASNLAVLIELQVFVPLLALIVGSAVVAEEVEDRTITYLFTRPVPRAALLFGRWLAALVFLAAVLSASVALLFFAASRAGGPGGPVDAGFARPLYEAALLAAAVYAAMFAVAGVFFRHPILVGLGYAFAVEGFLANLPGANRALAVQHHARSWLLARGPAEWREVEVFELLGFESAGTALAWLAGFLAASLALGAWRISRREYVLSS
jgi:ABC-2 type transport system permease protein